MTVANFQPTIWSKVILAALEKSLVFGGPGVSNDDYEGDVTAGNAVKITSFSDPTVSDYAQGTPISYDTLSDASQSLLINQQKYFGFQVDDVDRRQAAGDMQAYLEDRATYALAEKADEYLAGLYTGVDAGNVVQNSGSSSITVGHGIAPAVGTTDFFIKVIQPLNVKLSEALVPRQGRYLVVPPWANALLATSPAFTSVTDMSGEAAQGWQNGFIGRAGGFDIYESQNAVKFDTTNGAWVVQAGHPMALTYAQQIEETEALRSQNQFADLVRGLHVYGAKLVRPTAIAVAGVVRPAGL
jgi:hypothetical protein